MKTIRWLAVNGAIIACAWFGYIENATLCKNMFTFATWLAFVISLLTIVFHKSVSVKVNKRSVPKIISNFSDTLLIVLCAVHGDFFFASAWTLSMIAEQIIYGDGNA